MNKEEFADKVNEIYLKILREQQPDEVKDGYAPFCKHLFIENFTEALCNYAEITPENEQFLVTDYQERNERELSVLCRWFDKAKLPSHKAQYLDIILYSKAQIQLENEAMGTNDPNAHLDYDYGVVYIKP